MATVILSTQPDSTLSVFPNQNTTLTVAASADFDVATYTYQWKKSATAGGLIEAAQNITGATSASYDFEPVLANDGYVYYCTVNALGENEEDESVSSTGVTLTVTSESAGIYHKWVPKGSEPNQLNESGAERFRRMHHLGFC